MYEQVKVVGLGLGQMGSGIVKLLLQKHGIALVEVHDRRASWVGTDVGKAIGLEQPLGIRIPHDLPALVACTRPHMAIQATCSRVAQAVEDIKTCLRNGTDVISIAEEMAYPVYQAPCLTEGIHDLAIAPQVTVVGTGINPGFVMVGGLVQIITPASRTISGTLTAINPVYTHMYGPPIPALCPIGSAVRALLRPQGWAQ